ncbi:hypothetical protein HELRODRAFT_169693 [Helobdella robusta]|uniref:Uncharacterized protein n=1 Tax=Helobdella robusta TaxID=6412 RepID=T1F286_HELRO|nr:hypothetical protein HELRODRAFT_169693 [Helobdella robusta]ESO07975.1 hypothetical protein HELRODRAFT_169693 [Helobdella robusta]
MAGIVASTLRRKAFHKRAQDTKYQAIDQGHTNVSPTDSRSSSSSTLNRFECRSNVGKTPKGAQLCHVDFWPRCLNCAHPLIGVSNKTSVTNSTNPTANSSNKSSHKSHLSSNHNISNNLNPALLTVPQTFDHDHLVIFISVTLGF